MLSPVAASRRRRPHKAVSFVVEGDKEVQAWHEQGMPKAPPGFSGEKAARNKERKKGTQEL